MARGWDSKAIEDQQASAAEERRLPKKPPMTDAERERQGRRDGLQLARARLVHELAAAAMPGHKAMLEQALAHIDREIQAIG